MIVLDASAALELRRYHLAGDLSAERGDEALRDLADLDVVRYPHHVFLSRVWDLRAAVSAYDALYIALAEALDAPLLTGDRRLGAARGHRARVEVLTA